MQYRISRPKVCGNLFQTKNGKRSQGSHVHRPYLDMFSAFAIFFAIIFAILAFFLQARPS